ncbi:MAG: metallophosphoesterase [Tissierellia bacterium]|nr:metallophosphoesterase [Tissierellia bacterium]
MLRHKRGQIIKKRYIFLLLIIFIALIVYMYTPRGRIDVDTYTIENEKIPKSFDGFRIVQVSDFHNKQWDDKLINLIKQQSPDIIAVTGDLVDSRDTKPGIAYEFMRRAKQIAPVFYITGNHEARIDYHPIEKELRSMGIYMIDNKTFTLKIDEDIMKIIGIADPKFVTDYEDILASAIINSHIEEQKIDTKHFNLMLSHRPEAFLTYVNNDIDLVLSGHAHGGQFRLPFVGPFIAPGQGFFPKYTEGVYEQSNTSMVVSRGLGDSIIPIRVNNNYNLVIIELKVK